MSPISFHHPHTICWMGNITTDILGVSLLSLGPIKVHNCQSFREKRDPPGNRETRQMIVPNAADLCSFGVPWSRGVLAKVGNPVLGSRLPQVSDTISSEACSLPRAPPWSSVWVSHSFSPPPNPHGISGGEGSPQFLLLLVTMLPSLKSCAPQWV